MKWKIKTNSIAKLFLAVLIVSVLMMSLSFLTFQNVRVEATVSVVDSNITGDYATSAVRLQKQHKMFHANERYWIFYWKADYIYFRSSVDGSTWSSSTQIGSVFGAAAYFDVVFDGTYVHYVRRVNYVYDVKYRRGVPNSDGSITWSASEQPVQNTVGIGDPNLIVDSNGYPWMVDTYKPTGTYTIAEVRKSDHNDGTWQTSVGYPMDLSNRQWYMPTIVPLANGKVYAVYAHGDANENPKTPDVTYGRLYNGTGWESEQTVSTSKMAMDTFQEWDAIADPYGYVHSVFINATAHNILYVKRDNTTGNWGTEEQVYANVNDCQATTISYHEGIIYCFWNGYPTSNHIYYKTRGVSGWAASATDWIDDSSDGMPNKRNLMCSGKGYNNVIIVAWLSKTTSPYTIKFNILVPAADTQAPTYSNIGVNTTLAGQPCKFHVKWTDNIALSGYIFGTNNTGSWVNDTWASLSGNPAWSNVTKTLNSTVGVKIAYRFWCNDTSDNWADTGLTFLTTSSEDVTIEIYDSWVSDSRLDYGTQVTIKFRHRYSNNQTACETGTSYVNGTSCVINATGWITYTKTYSAVVKYTFTISQVNVKGYTTFQMVTNDAEVIWDRLEVESYGTGDNRANINSYVVYWWKLRYDYDNVAFTNAKGNCSIGATPAIWSSYNSRWELNVLLPSTPQSYSQTLTFTDTTYGLTVITGTTSQNVIADRVNINSFSVYDNRINVGDTASFSVSGKYDYDSSVWSGTYTLNESTSKSSVGKYWYSIQSVTDSTYGLTAFQQSASNVYVIFDKLTVTFSANDTSVDAGKTVMISWIITRQYDSSTVTSFTIDISRNGILWQTLTNNSKTDVSYAAALRIYTLFPSSITDNTYGITVAQANSVTVVWGEEEAEEFVVPSGAIVYGTGFNIYFLTNTNLAFQHPYVSWMTNGATITLTVTSGTLNGSACTLVMYSISGRLTFTSQENAIINLTSTDDGTTFQINGETKDSASITVGSVTISWSIPRFSYLNYTTLFMGIGGVIMMIFSPMWMIHKIKEEGFLEVETVERFGYCMLIFLIGFGLMVMWLWG